MESTVNENIGIAIPLDIFMEGLPTTQALIKYLHEERALTISEIAIVLDKSYGSIYTLYRRSLEADYNGE